MSEGDIAEPRRGSPLQGSGPSSAPVLPFPATPKRVSFDRSELQTILNVYGRKVAEGEWRDYALDFLADKAVFSIYRRTSEVPLYRVEKDPRLARKQGAYSVVVASGLILKRGNDLTAVLRVIDKPLKVVSN
ncbi:DUF2794 domain-containing protein [Microvirga antarctica]|uniref:DUF2794 domain-containing protein n=1 Tax=Microvirga antarctica TaxID=2819233 RepID=UPI001B31052E|nr:DUF2794 domain-containing protein [Microvirga antarctica]